MNVNFFKCYLIKILTMTLNFTTKKIVIVGPFSKMKAGFQCLRRIKIIIIFSLPVDTFKA